MLVAVVVTIGMLVYRRQANSATSVVVVVNGDNIDRDDNCRGDNASRTCSYEHTCVCSYTHILA